MNLDFAKSYDYVEQEFRNSRDFEASVRAVCNWLAKQVPHDDWNKINALNVTGDLQIAKEWLPNLLGREQCPFRPKSIFFNILDIFGEEDDYGAFGPNHADMCPVLFAHYDAADDSLQWIYGNERFDIDDSNADLPALKEAGLLFNSSEGIGSEVYIAHSVGYVLLLLRHLLDETQYALLQAERPVGVVAGFGSGDLFSLGELTSDGFVVRSKPFCETGST